MTENRKILYTNDLDGFDKVSTEDFVVSCIMIELNLYAFSTICFLFPFEPLHNVILIRSRCLTF